MPVARQITPPMIIAIRIPLPVSAAVAPNDTNRPVPKIIAAVRSVAVVFPRLRLLERADLNVVVEGVIAFPLTKSFLDSAAQRYTLWPTPPCHRSGRSR